MNGRLIPFKQGGNAKYPFVPTEGRKVFLLNDDGFSIDLKGDDTFYAHSGA